MEKATHMKTSTNIIIKKALEQKTRFLLEPDAKKLCSEWGIPIPTFEVSKTKKETAEIADMIGYPIVLKVVSPDILHKTEVGGVLTSLNNRIEVEQAYDLM
jgi:acyl-CoA synthetase (NDP forming)